MAAKNAVTVKAQNGESVVLYEPMNDPRCDQTAFHASNCPNLLALGTRDTGKSTMGRWDVIIRCLMYAGFKALIIRRKITDLRKSHLRFIDAEMKALGAGRYRDTTHDVMFDNGSFIQFSHCENMKDVNDYLSSEWDYILFDELSTFTLEMFLLISAAARSPNTKPYKALVRALSNPVGIGAGWMKQWFIDKNVNLAEYPDYCPDDFHMQFSSFEGNKYVDQKEVEKRLRNAPKAVREAWLKGTFVVEGAYFEDFEKQKVVNDKVVPWHCINTIPTWKGKPLHELDWLNIYRSLDWGYYPDPWVCHWHVVLPNKHKITFKERQGTRMLAADVAQLIKQQSKGMHVVTTYADPTMFIKTGNAPYSIAEIFEQNGVPLTAAQNDRELYGYVLHDMMNTIIDDHPSWQIVEPACPELVRTIPLLQMDSNDPRKIANGPDHWAISCAYFGMGDSPPSRDTQVPATPLWMQPKRCHRFIGTV